MYLYSNWSLFKLLLIFIKRTVINSLGVTCYIVQLTYIKTFQSLFIRYIWSVFFLLPYRYFSVEKLYIGKPFIKFKFKIFINVTKFIVPTLENVICSSSFVCSYYYFWLFWQHFNLGLSPSIWYRYLYRALCDLWLCLPLRLAQIHSQI